jgi:hypothetical protein
VGAIPLFDIRADAGDTNAATCLARGYDEHGHPLCLHGRKMQPNGHDYAHRRTKWCCQKACRTPSTQAVPDCPYLAEKYKHGQVVNVGRTLPNGSMRLAREIPYGSQTWKRRYGRRNLSESRNGLLQGMGLKRLPSFGLPRAHREVAIGDFLENLRTVSRLVEEATTLALKAKPG